MNSVFAITCAVLLPGSCSFGNEQLLHPGAAFDCSIFPSKCNTGIKPFMMASCVISGYHNATNTAAGVEPETYEQLSAVADKVEQRAVVEKAMPVAWPLSTTVMNKISCRMNQGSPDN